MLARALLLCGAHPFRCGRKVYDTKYAYGARGCSGIDVRGGFGMWIASLPPSSSGRGGAGPGAAAGHAADVSADLPVASRSDRRRICTFV